VDLVFWLTASNLPPAFFSLPSENGLWEVVADYSGATASDSHGLPFRSTERYVSFGAYSPFLTPTATHNKKALGSSRESKASCTGPSCCAGGPHLSEEASTPQEHVFWLTASNLPPAFFSLSSENGLWEVVADYSGATASDTHGLPLRSTERYVSFGAYSPFLTSTASHKKALGSSWESKASCTRLRLSCGRPSSPRRSLYPARTRLLAYGIKPSSRLLLASLQEWPVGGRSRLQRRDRVRFSRTSVCSCGIDNGFYRRIPGNSHRRAPAVNILFT
jgi:hypothetical protein